MDGECMNCGESGNWCRCEEPQQFFYETIRIPEPDPKAPPLIPIPAPVLQSFADAIGRIIRA